MTIDLLAALRAGSRGLFTEEAAVELLIAEAGRLGRRDFTNAVLSVGPGPAWGEEDMATIDWAEACDRLIGGLLPCSSGERAILRLAASVAGHHRVLLGDALTSLDEATSIGRRRPSGTPAAVVRTISGRQHREVEPAAGRGQPRHLEGQRTAADARRARHGHQRREDVRPVVGPSGQHQTRRPRRHLRRRRLQRR